MVFSIIKGKEILVDDDFKTTSTFSLDKDGYAVSSKGKMHRLVMSVKDPTILVDRINGNRLDNRRSNLRLVTSSENRLNRKKKTIIDSKWKGVSKSGFKWRAHIAYKNINTYLGTFETAIDAAKAYNLAAKILHGPFASLNEVENER